MATALQQQNTTLDMSGLASADRPCKGSGIQKKKNLIRCEANLIKCGEQFR